MRKPKPCNAYSKAWLIICTLTRVTLILLRPSAYLSRTIGYRKLSLCCFPSVSCTSALLIRRQVCNLSRRFLLAIRDPAADVVAMIVLAACSSSALALHDAIADLTAGRCDFAMVGGASSILRPATSVAFNKLHMLSPDGSCKSFSAAANGCVQLLGCSAFIVSRLELLLASGFLSLTCSSLCAHRLSSS